MTLQRLRALIRRRVRYHVTRGGALFTLALTLTGTGAFLSGNNLLYLIFSAMVALLLVSGFLSRLVLSGLELELLLPEHVAARSPSPARVRIRNLKRLTPSFSIELAGRRDAVKNTPSIMTAPVYFPLIPGRTTIEAPIQVTFPWRGRHRENLFALSTRFPFGFLRKTTMVALNRETIVYPSLEPETEAELLLEDVAGEVETQSRGSGLDFYRIRPYETSDSARLVDWKITAHTGNLQVREFSREQQRPVEIYLDRVVPPGAREWFERAVEQCAFLVWHLTERGIEVWFRADRLSLTVPGEADAYAVLRYLALAEPVIGARPEGDCRVESPMAESGVRIVFSAQPAEFSEAGWQAARTVAPGERVGATDSISA